MKVLVTGGAGFIGSHLVGKLLREKEKVVCVDNFNNYYDSKIKYGNIRKYQKDTLFKVYNLDICLKERLDEVFDREKFDVVVHLAAMVGVRSSFTNPISYEKVNIFGTTNVLDLATKYKVRHFIFTSSSSIYGNSKLPFLESFCPNYPISPYGITKKAGELLCFFYHQNFNLKVTILRLFTVYGPCGRPDMAPFLFTKAILEEKPLVQFGDGRTKRDYTYIDDVISGIFSAIGKRFDFEIINLATGRAVSLTSFIDIIEKIIGKKARIRKKQLQKGDIYSTLADIRKAKKMLGFKPRWRVEDGMKVFIKRYLSRNSSNY